MNYYHILKINQTATNKEIKQHYYQLAKKYHPDKTKGDPEKSEKFKLLSEAYSTLSNPKKRYLYDLKNNYDVDINLNFTDKDYEQLHYYYNKIMNFTEIKFIRLLFSSLPSDVRINIKNKISNFINLGRQREGQKQIIHLRDIKYINIQHLKDNYTLNLIRNFDDIYNNKLKQIIIIGENIYHLFITSYNYAINISNNGSLFRINLIGDLQSFQRDQYNIIFNQPINLYQYYYGDSFNLTINHKKYDFQNKLNHSHRIQSLGFKNPLNGERGDLYINFTVDLTRNNINDDNQILIKEIFNI